jgi:alkylated DNA repair dioxygenase AlkB
LSWSFGATRTFLVKHVQTKQVHSVSLSSGDVLSMNGNFQQQYVHWSVVLLDNSPLTLITVSLSIPNVIRGA